MIELSSLSHVAIFLLNEMIVIPLASEDDISSRSLLASADGSPFADADISWEKIKIALLEGNKNIGILKRTSITHTGLK